MAKNIKIRGTTLADLSAVHALVNELAVFEKSPESHTATVAEYEADFLAKIFESHVAIDTDTDKIIGMILYHMAYSTWRGKMLYLEDFVVTESYRQFGVGQMLFDTFLQVAREKNCVLTKWQVLDWNTPAINFYKKNKAIIEDEWYNGKIFLTETI